MWIKPLKEWCFKAKLVGSENWLVQNKSFMEFFLPVIFFASLYIF